MGAVSTLAKGRYGAGKSSEASAWIVTSIRPSGCCARQPLSHGTVCLAQAVSPGHPGTMHPQAGLLQKPALYPDVAPS